MFKIRSLWKLCSRTKIYIFFAFGGLEESGKEKRNSKYCWKHFFYIDERYQEIKFPTQFNLHSFVNIKMRLRKCMESFGSFTNQKQSSFRRQQSKILKMGYGNVQKCSWKPKHLQYCHMDFEYSERTSSWNLKSHLW